MSPLPFLNRLASKLPVTLTVTVDTKNSTPKKNDAVKDELPTLVHYPKNPNSEWNVIPLGVAADGEVSWDVTEHAHSLIVGSSGGGKSTLQRNIIAHCLHHKDHWTIFGIDVKRVELTSYEKYTDVVAGVAKNVADGVEMLRFARDEMTNRYQEMERLGVDNFQNLPQRPKALLIMIDEFYMFLAPTGIKTDEGKEEDALKGEALHLLLEISRLGRAAGIHLSVATQIPDATVLFGEFKKNLEVRIAAGRMDSIASVMTLDNVEATNLPGRVKGRGYFQIDGSGKPFQGYLSTLDEVGRVQGDDVG